MKQLGKKVKKKKKKNGTTLVEVISKAGSLPGIKVDTGAKDSGFQFK